MRSAGWIVLLALGCKSSDPAPDPAPAPAPEPAKHAGSGTDRHKPVMADAPPVEVGVSIKGVTSDYISFSTFDAERGRMISPIEIDSNRPVLVEASLM